MDLPNILDEETGELELGSTDTKIYFKTLPAIVKIIALVVLTISIILGFEGHFSSKARDRWNDPEGVKVICSNASNLKMTRKLKCPSDSIQNEVIFLSLTILLFIPTLLSLVAFSLWVCKYGHLPSKVKIADAFYHIVAGVVLLSSSVFMVTSPIQIEEFERKVDEDKSGVDFDLAKYRVGHYFGVKIASGVLAFVSGIIFKVAACTVLTS